MFDSIIQPPAGVLPVQHEFVTIATGHSFLSEMNPQGVTTALYGSLPSTGMYLSAVDTQQSFGALDNAPPTPPK